MGWVFALSGETQCVLELRVALGLLGQSFSGLLSVKCCDKGGQERALQGKAWVDILCCQSPAWPMGAPA